MAFQILVNIIIAFMWMFLSESYTMPSFIAGFIWGLLLVLLLNRFIPGRFYGIRVVKILKLILIFMRELILSNLSILKLVYTPRPEIEPGIFALPLEVKSNWEITLLAHLITLTPGTLSVAVSDNNDILYIHAMDIDEVDESIKEIKNSFEKAILEVTR
ncbi:Na+/H+ antiporter subunit E [Ornithinibacillus scapharcae]|uniref:Na+/H+ antiporter subunit E n=1 Tax=Ornithinibacillus scapharcae TaxID=1147159 RepID=UPI000225B7D7|nr:Na+/H+ antiporter subunit E [Ornithinibacillus scapharcae]